MVFPCVLRDGATWQPWMQSSWNRIMAQQFSLDASQERVTEFLRPFGVNATLLPQTEFGPLSKLLTLRMTAEDEWTVEPRSWGFLPSRWRPSRGEPTTRDCQSQMTNVRADVTETSFPWRRTFGTQRCVLLASSFAMPDRDGGIAQYSLPDHPVFVFAVMWDRYTGDDGNGHEVTVDSCVMLKTESNPLVFNNHRGNRRNYQPVLIAEPDDIRRYCSLAIRDTLSIRDLSAPWPGNRMECVVLGDSGD